MGPGEHSLVFGPEGLSAALAEALLARAGRLGFRLLLAERAGDPADLRARIAAAPGGPDALAAGRARILDAAALEAVPPADGQGGPLAPALYDADHAGYQGVLAVVLHGAPGPGQDALEAALAARPDPRLALVCAYAAPPPSLDDALRLLRAHTPGRMVMPATWRLAEAAAEPDPAPAFARPPGAELQASLAKRPPARA